MTDLIKVVDPLGGEAPEPTLPIKTVGKQGIVLEEHNKAIVKSMKQLGKELKHAVAYSMGAPKLKEYALTHEPLSAFIPEPDHDLEFKTSKNPGVKLEVSKDLAKHALHGSVMVPEIELNFEFPVNDFIISKHQDPTQLSAFITDTVCSELVSQISKMVELKVAELLGPSG